MKAEHALERGLSELGLMLPAGGETKLLAYLALLAKWNRTYNLTAITDPLEMVTHHLLDSLAVVPHLPLLGQSALADVGSGAGLPGVPIAIARPDWRVTLNDASGKKAAFLRQASVELALPNLSVHEGRVEAWNPTSRFSVVISRAFAELSEFISLCRHLVVPDGFLAAMKGTSPDAEVGRAGGTCIAPAIIRLKVPFLAAQRHLVLCKGIS